MPLKADNDNPTLEQLLRRIAGAASVSGRQPEDIKVVAVTKAHPVGVMVRAYEWGFKTLGESRVMETEQKLAAFPYRQSVDLHLIGHLQTNKVRKAIDIYDVIESVDSLKLAKKINLIAGESEKIQRVYLQVNSGNDPAKYGMKEDKVLSNANEFTALKNLQIEGMMVVAPLTTDEEILRETFSKTRLVKEQLIKLGFTSMKSLSMGMSSDFEIAIEEGATHIRIGTALFGKRD